MHISQISWGDDSAEQDPHLLQYFVGSEALGRLQRREKAFVIGRKGSGKSALRRKLEEDFNKQPQHFVINIAPKYTSIRNILNEQSLADGFGEEIFFQYTWLRQIYLDCLAKYGAVAGGAFASGYSAFARDIARTRLATPVDLVENISEILQKIKLKAGKLGDLGLAIEKELREASDIDSLEHNLKGLADEGNTFIVLIDDLDLGWDNSPLSNRLLLGLLAARNYLASLSRNIFPAVFLREDVYEILISQSGHADKYRNIEKIRWDKDKLVSLLTMRINFARKQHHESETLGAFSTVFPEMVGTSHSVNWLIDRTLSRPRELIQLVRYYTEQVKSTEPNPELLKNAENDYSNWKLADLCSEYGNQYPKLESVFSFWRTKFFRNKYHLSRAEIDEILLRIMMEVPINEDWFNALVKDADTRKFLSILYEIGFIGDFIKGGAGGSKTAYSFADPHEPVFDEIQIHPCFRRAVGTVERIRNRESNPDNSGTEPTEMVTDEPIGESP
jgi:hypothetical protein